MHDILSAAAWWLAISILGLAAWPVTCRLFCGLPYKGYAFQRVMGLLLVSYLAWLLSFAGLLTFSFTTIIICTLLIFAAGVAVSGPSIWLTALEYARANWRYVLVTEGLFLAAFASMAFLRSFTPEIAATEKPMDFAMLNALVRHSTGQPADPWLSGYGINYYYFGYLMSALLAKLSLVPAGIAFNLSIASTFALASVGAFGIVSEMLGGRARGRAGYLLGLSASLLLVVCGNLYAGFRFLQNPTLTWSQDWWTGIGWNSSRIIVDMVFGEPRPTINEFPAFSFSLGDLHPHLLALPVGLLAIALVLSMLMGSKGLWKAGRVSALPFFHIVAAAIILGALYFANSWDFPTYTLLFVVALVLGYRREMRPALLLGAIGLIVVLSVLFYLPFYATFQSVVGAGNLPLPPEVAAIPLISRLSDYIGIVIWEKTTLSELITIFGVFLAVLWPFTALQGLKTAFLPAPNGSYVQYVTIIAGLAFSLIIGLIFRFPLFTLLVPVIILGTYHLCKSKPSPAWFAVLLSTLAFSLIFGCELVFLQDAFHDRMNTVFKFYYQAWVLLAIATPIAVYEGAAEIRQIIAGATTDRSKTVRSAVGSMWLTLFGLLFVLSLFYPVIATKQKLAQSVDVQTLNGAAYLSAWLPSDSEAISWLSEHAEPGAVILEATGPPYSLFSRVSSFTGIPTVLGWANHERQWRAGQDWAFAEIEHRTSDIETIYSSEDVELAEALLKQYGVDYVIVGSIERGLTGSGDTAKHYSPAALEKFVYMGDVVFQSGDTTIYRIPN